MRLFYVVEYWDRFRTPAVGSIDIFCHCKGDVSHSRRWPSGVWFADRRIAGTVLLCTPV